MSLTREQGMELRSAIEDRRRALLVEIQDGLARSREDNQEAIAGPSGDPGDISVADLVAHLGHADARRDVGELREIEAARVRLEEGTYGDCQDCGREIDFRRLRAYPAALRCIECQTRYEKTHAGGAGSTL